MFGLRRRAATVGPTLARSAARRARPAVPTLRTGCGVPVCGPRMPEMTSSRVRLSRPGCGAAVAVASSAVTASCSVPTLTSCRPGGRGRPRPRRSSRPARGRPWRPPSCAAAHLELDAADVGATAVGVDRAGAGDEPAAGEVAGGEHVDDAEREHQPGRRAADVAEATVTSPSLRQPAPAARPARPRGESVGRAQRERDALGLAPSRRERPRSTGSAGLRGLQQVVDRLRLGDRGAVDRRDAVARPRACRRPADPATTSAIATTGGQPSSRTAADSAFISDVLKSWAFFSCTCSSVMPGG